MTPEEKKELRSKLRDPEYKVELALKCTQLLNSADFAAHGKDKRNGHGLINEIQYLEIAKFVNEVLNTLFEGEEALP